MNRNERFKLGLASLMVALMVVPSALAFVAGDMTTEPGSKVLVWTREPGVIRDLERSNVDVLETYGSFALVVGKRSALKDFEVMEGYDLDTVEFAEYTIDQRTGEVTPELPDDLVLGPEGYGESGHYMVQFHGPIKQAWKDDLGNMGVDIYDYYPNNAFLVRMDRDLVPKVEDHPKVQYVGLYQPAFKVQRGLLDLGGAHDLTLIVFDDAAVDQTLARLSELGELDYMDATTHIKVGLRLDIEDVKEVAQMDAVKWIERSPVWVPYSQTASWIIQSGVNGLKPIYDAGIHGENQTIYNTDTGIVVSHEAYHDTSRSVQYSAPASNNPPDNAHRKILNYWTFADSTDMSSAHYHGTHTNGVTAGDAVPNGGTFNGIAWASKISFGDIFYTGGGSGIPSNLNSLWQRGFNDGATVSSNSWGSWFSNGAYDASSQESDEFSWANKDFLILSSAGNTGSSAGTVSSPSTAKNTISIGAAELSASGDMMGYSSRGPTDDGRLKPELYTPTDEIGPCGSTTCGTTTYASAGGTSNSCPAAAGGTLLARQYYADGFYPTGTKQASDAFEPTGALVRATVLNGAKESNGQDTHDHPYNGMPYPNNDQGWGYMNLDNVLYLEGDTKKIYIDDHTTGLSTGGSADYYLSIKDSAVPLEITVTWFDYPGALGAGTELVNNLDLTVEGPAGTYKGNVFKTSGTPHESTTGGSADGKNNDEVVLLVNPPTGGYTITVTATNVAQSTQPFALVATGDFVRDPDLAILKNELTVEPIGIASEGDTIWFNGTVHNYGGLVSATVPLDFEVDGTKVDSSDFDLTLGDQAEFSFSWVAKAGLHDFGFTLDPLDIVTEGDEENNHVDLARYFNGLPIAAVEYAPDRPLTKQMVTIDASQSTDDGSITWYKFDFGDGSKTNWVKLPTAGHAYVDDGFYNITAWVKDNMSVISDPAHALIEVLNRGPSANASAAVYEAYTFFEISFDGSQSHDEDGTITFEWNFGDGTNSSDDRPSHNWSDNGEYIVSLTVTDDDGAVNSTNLAVNILNQAPTVFFETSEAQGNVTTPFECNGTAWDKDGFIDEWFWDFGDGNTSDEEDPVYFYSDDGDYIISLYVLDDDGASSNVMNLSVIIDNLPPTANFTASALEVDTFDDIKFKDLSIDIDGRIIGHTWNMGDGKFSTDAEPTHSYKENGIYTVRLTVQDDDGETDTYEIKVTVNNRPPVAVAVFNDTAFVGDLVTLYATNSSDPDGEIKGYEWSFNATDRKVGQVVTYAFWEPGVHNFTLTVRDNDGATDTIELVITIKKKPKPPPLIDISGGLGSLFMLLMMVIVIVGIVAGVILAAKHRKKRSTPGVGKKAIDKVAEVPPSTTSSEWDTGAQTSETDVSGGYHYPAYGQEVEAHPFYAEEEQPDQAYDMGDGYEYGEGTESETDTYYDGTATEVKKEDDGTWDQ